MNRKILASILASTYLLFLSGPSFAVIDDFQDAVDAYNRGDYKTSYKLIFPLAEKGFAQAQYNLGVMYEKGKGVKQDHKKAVKWFRLAAAQELAKAIEKLNLLSKEKAKKKLREGSEALVGGSHKLNAKNFQDGLDAFSKKDYKTAHQLFSRLAEQGVTKAQYNLALMYSKGNGVRRYHPTASL